MTLEDHLILYPNPSNKNVNDILYRKKEFYDDKLLPVGHEDKKEEETRDVLKYQESNARFSTFLANFDKRLIYFAPGTGKTKLSIETVELMFEQCEYLNMKAHRVLYLLSNKELIANTKAEIFKHHPELYPIDDDTSEIKKNKMLAKKYVFDTYTSFAKNQLQEKFQETVAKYSYTIVVCDEIHELTGMRGKTEKEFENVYESLHSFFHEIKSSKILLMSATPMRDNVNEISSVMNLILDMEDQLPDNLDTSYFDAKNRLKPEYEEKLKKIFRNKVSYLTSATNVPFKYITNGDFYDFKFLKLYFDSMGKFQQRNYLRIKEESEDKGFRKSEQYASSFVFPDGSTGKAGYEKYIKTETRQVRKVLKNKKSKKVNVSEFKLDPEFVKLLKPTPETTIAESLKLLQKYSCKFASAIEKIINNEDDVCFWFSEYVHGTGTILFATILKDVFGFKPANGKVYSKDDEKRVFTYSLITGGNILKELQWCNSKQNIRGEVVKVVISSKLLATGYNLNNIKQVHIDTAHWNFNQIYQTISRALRFNGNNKLIEAGIDPTVNIYLHASKMTEGEQSIDIDMYKVSEEKDYKIKQVERIAKVAAIDCALNYDVNRIQNAQDGSRECDYQKCDYKCEGVKTLKINNSELDKDTYRLLYQKRIIDEYADDFKTDLISSQILNANNIKDNIYLNTKVLFELKNTSRVMRSRLGFSCFAQSDNDRNIFLSNDTHDSISSWYTTFPIISYQKSLSDVLQHSDLVNDYIKQQVSSINDMESVEDVKQVLDKLPSWVFEFLLKNIYKTIMVGLSHSSKRWSRKNITEYFDDEESSNKIVLASENRITVYPKLILLDINEIVWKLKFSDDIDTIDWTVQTGTQTDTSVTELEAKYKQRAIDNNFDFIGKVKGQDLSSLKLLQTNVERSTGRDCFTVPAYYFIYFIVRFNIKRPGDIDDIDSDKLNSIIKKNKDVKEFDSKYEDTELSSSHWSKSTKRNVIYWLQKENNKPSLCDKVYDILKENKILILI